MLHVSTRETLAPRIRPDDKFENGLRWLLFVLFYCVVVNVPYWTASRLLGLLPLGWICAEYVCVGLLSFFLSRITITLLLLLLIAADMVSGISKTYFLAPSECLTNISLLHELPGCRLLAVAAVAILTLLVAAFASSSPVKELRGAYRRSAAVCLIAVVCASLSIDCVSYIRETGAMPHPLDTTRRFDSRNLDYFRTRWMSRYPELRLFRTQKFMGGHGNAASLKSEQARLIASASGAAVRAAIGFGPTPQGSPNLVVILTESWGILKDPAMRESLVRPYLQPDLLARYDVSQGTIPFYGSTVDGEARELCDSKMGTQIIHVPGPSLKTCLPDRLASIGYHTVALHGMDGNMFRRASWYPVIGFQEQWFRSTFRQQGLPDCLGAFTGTCDAAVADWMGKRLQKKNLPPTFIYWVTLNSHLPVPVPSAIRSPASCSLTPLLEARPALCSWYQLIANVHDSVSQVAMADLARPTIFVIVGDHAPPFADEELRDQFSATEVPFVMLVPRADTLKSKWPAELQAHLPIADPMKSLGPDPTWRQSRKNWTAVKASTIRRTTSIVKGY